MFASPAWRPASNPTTKELGVNVAGALATPALLALGIALA